MAIVNETIFTGRKFRKLIDRVGHVWARYSFWSKAGDTECNDGQTVETKVGAVKGITTDLNTTQVGYAADMTTVAELNNNIKFPDGTGFYPDIKDGEKGFNTKPSRGADTFIPFKNLSRLIFNLVGTFAGGNYTTSYSFSQLTIGEYYILVYSDYNRSKHSVSSGGKELFSYNGNYGGAAIGNIGIIFLSASSTTLKISVPSHNGGTTAGLFRIS